MKVVNREEGFHDLREEISEVSINKIDFNELARDLSNIESISIERLVVSIVRILKKHLKLPLIAILINNLKTIYIDSDYELDQAFLEIIKINVLKVSSYMNSFIDVSVEVIHEGNSKASVVSTIYAPLRSGLTEIGTIYFLAGDKNNARQISKSINIISAIISSLLAKADYQIKYRNVERDYIKSLKVRNTLINLYKDLSANEELEHLAGSFLSQIVKELELEAGFIAVNKNSLLTVISAVGFDDVSKIVKSLKFANWTIFEKKPLVLMSKPPKDVNVLEYQWIKLDVAKHFNNENLKTGIVFPLNFSNRIIGIIGVFSKKEFLSVQLVNNIFLFGIYFSNVLENYRLQKLEFKRTNELVKLNEIGKLINSTYHFSEVVDKVLKFISEIINFDIGGIFILKENYSILDILSSGTPTSSQIEFIKELLQDSHEAFSIVSFSKETMHIDIKILNKTKKLEGTINSFCVIPIFVKGEVKGSIIVASLLHNAFTSEDLRTLSTFASQVGIAIENAIVYEGLEKKVKELSFLFEVGKTVSSTLDLNKVLEFITILCVQAVNGKTSLVWLKDEKKDELKIFSAYGVPDYFKSFTLKVGEGIVGRVMLTGKPESIRNVMENKYFKEKGIAKQFNLVSMVAIPLIVRNMTIGVIQVFCDYQRDFSDSDISLLQTFASQASVAIENAKFYKTIRNAYLSTVSALSAAIDAKDHYTHGHSSRVMYYSVLIAKEMQLPAREIENIRLAGLLHDIGKIGVPEYILLKPGRLTDEEFEEIKKHPVYGKKILENVEFLKEVLPLTYYHHEKWDGTGYPEGLKGEEIPIGARILSVADTFDAMTSTRAYREAIKDEIALEEILKNAGKQFDPEVVEAFKRVYLKMKTIYYDMPLREVVEDYVKKVGYLH